jgi:hypothetical protein
VFAKLQARLEVFGQGDSAGRYAQQRNGRSKKFHAILLSK